MWIRTTGKLPDDPAIHQCVLAYASDMSLLDTALVPHGRSLFEKDFMGASLDHALWLHRPFRADDWLLYAQESPSMTGSRGFCARADLPPRRRAGRERRAGGAGADQAGRRLIAGQLVLPAMLSATASAMRMPSTPADRMPPA